MSWNTRMNDAANCISEQPVGSLERAFYSNGFRAGAHWAALNPVHCRECVHWERHMNNCAGYCRRLFGDVLVETAPDFGCTAASEAVDLNEGAELGECIKQILGKVDPPKEGE